MHYSFFIQASCSEGRVTMCWLVGHGSWGICDYLSYAYFVVDWLTLIERQYVVWQQ